MSRYLKTLLVVLSVCTTTGAAAGNTDLYVIPIAAHTDGAFGTAWRSDVVLHNLQPVPITVEMALIESGRPAAVDAVAVSFGGETALHLLPGETRIVSDVLGHMNREISGALIVGANMPFALTSRTHAERASGRTLGQTVHPIAISGGADAVNEVAVLPGLGGSERQRTNVGLFVAASRAPFVAEIEIVSASGTKVGSQRVELATEGFFHQQFSASAIVAGFEGVSAVVSIVQGEGVIVPYASMVNNDTAEAIFVPADAATNRVIDARTMLRATVSRTDAR